MVSIKHKIIYITVTCSIALTFVALVNGFSSQELQGKYSQLIQNSLLKRVAYSELYTSLLVVDMASDELEGRFSKVEDRKNIIEKIDKDYLNYTEKVQKIESQATTEEKTVNAEYYDIVKKYNPCFSQILAFAKAGEERKFNDLKNKECGPLVDSMKGVLQGISQHYSEESEQSLATIENLRQKFEFWTLVISGFGLLFSMGFGYLVSRSAIASVSAVGRHLQDSANDFMTLSGKLVESSGDLSSSSTSQAAALQETVAAIDETSAMILRNAENSSRSQQESASSSQAAGRGQQAVIEMINSMNEIEKSNEKIMKRVELSQTELQQIVQVIEEIAKKTQVINDIVFQTKLLSFNASVEAARAGEHGKGFAVVAEEIGNLAQLSGSSAKEIRELLDSSVEKVQFMVTNTRTEMLGLMTTGKQIVHQGNASAVLCGTVLKEIVSSVEQVHIMLNEIASASSEQAAGVQEITKAINKLDELTHTNATSANQSMTFSDQLRDHAETISKELETLNQVVGISSEVRVSSVKAASHMEEGPKYPKTVPLAKNKTSTNNVIPIRSLRKNQSDAAISNAFTKGYSSVKTDQKEEMVSSASKATASAVKAAAVVPSHEDTRFEDV